MRFIALAFVLAGLFQAAPAHAQNGAQVDTLFRIVAIVGDSIVTNVELEQALDLYAQQSGTPVPESGPARDSIVNTLLEERINALLLVQAARRDTSIVVAEEQVRSAVDRQVQTVIRQSFNGNTQAFEQALRESNLTQQEYRDMLSSQFRHQQLIAQYFQKLMRDRRPPPVTDDEIRKAFEEAAERQGELPKVPPSISFDQILVPVTPGDTALARARALADSLANAIRNGEAEFEAVARRWSADEASRELGGDIGWFRPGIMYAEFENAAFSLRPGQISPPVRTPYGFHVIKVERIRGPERQARHILIRPTTTPEDAERARALAESIAEQIRAGASLDSLRRAHGDPDEPPRITNVPVDSLDVVKPGYLAALSGANERQVVGPVRIDGPIVKFAVLRVQRITPERTATVQDYRTVIQNQLARQKLEEEIIAELRRQTYIEIRLKRNDSGG